ncbi:type IV pilus biogenesis protein PilM [Enterobacteriaceae bacterium LUAb1]
MAYHTWQVGLDIQNGQLCALAVQRRRQGWQLRQWWQKPLPEKVLHNGVLHSLNELTEQLQRWRHHLPRHFSLRVGFPPQSVLQHHITQPPPGLRKADHNRYIAASASRLFPVDTNALVLDYRTTQATSESICLTATRRETFDSWLTVLRQASLEPQVMELSPNALGLLSTVLGFSANTILVHRLSDHWIWYRVSAQQPGWGWCSRADIDDFSVLRETYFNDSAPIWFSASQPGLPPEGTQVLQPLQALIFQQPPLPAYPPSFALAAGLALRPEDTDGCR